MRHRRAKRRIPDSRDRLNLLRALVEHERITTTQSRGKELVQAAEHLVTLGKKGDVHARRLAYRALGRRPAVKKLFDTVAPRYAGRAGGTVRMVRVGERRGDAAPMVIVEFVH